MKLHTNIIGKIAVFRALQLGDMLCAVPAVRALRRAYPEAEISLIGLPWAQTFVNRFDSYFDRFIIFPGYPGLPEQAFRPESVVNFIGEMQKENFDLVIQMQGNGSYVNPLTELFAAKHLAGYFKEEDYCPDENLFLVYPNYGSEIERHLMLMHYLGITESTTDLEFPLKQEDFSAFDSASLLPPNKQYVCVHPGSRGTWRQWPPKYFAQTADYCHEQGYQVILTGTENERALTGEVKALMNHPALDFAGKTSLGSMGVLISKAVMLISNCTGVSHMAAAFKTPSIVISMDGEPERWAPLNTSIHKTTNWLQTPDVQRVLGDLKSLIRQIKYNGSPEATKTSL